MQRENSNKQIAIAAAFLVAGLGSWWLVQKPGRPRSSLAGSTAQSAGWARPKRSQEIQNRECVRIYREAMDAIVRLQRAQADAAVALAKEGPLAMPASSNGRWAVSRMNQIMDMRPIEGYVLDLQANNSAGLIGNLLGSLRGHLNQKREMAFNFAAALEQGPAASGDDASRERLRKVIQGNVEVEQKSLSILLKAIEEIEKLD